MAPEAEGSSPFTHPRIIKVQRMSDAPVAQLDRVADFESVGRRFESYRARHILEDKKVTTAYGPLAQLVEQLTLNQ